MRRKLAFAVVVMALAMGSVAQTAVGAGVRYTPGAPGLGDPYYPLDGNGGYDVRHYLLDVKYEPARDRLTGVATIRARATQNLSRFNLDFVGLSVQSIKVDGRTARWSRDAGELTVRPKSGLRKGSTFEVVVRYRGTPETLIDLFGLSGFIHTDDGALVVGEPHVAATWFPANDHPSDKAAFTFRITVPRDLEAVANGILKSKRASGAWRTWVWDAREPMTTYLAGMGIGQFELRSYRAGGIRYWDAVDSTLMADRAPAITPADGSTMLYSEVGEPAYKRLTRTIAVPPGGTDLAFQVDRDTEEAWDFLFVEARTAGGDDWTTLPDANGHTSQDVGACPGFLGANPWLAHYLTDVPPDLGDPDNPDDDIYYPCEPVGSTSPAGAWHAASGTGSGWESWLVTLPNDGATTRLVEVSITYASDQFVQGRGVALDAIVVGTGDGSTSFEADGDQLDGWVAPLTGPEGSADNPNTWTPAATVAALPGLGAAAFSVFDRQPEIIAFEASLFGRYPFSAAGGIVDAVGIGFALENQTRPIYSPFFFTSDVGGTFGVVHELAHQWVGDSVAVERWQHIWLNEGFATYVEWLWSEREGLGTAQEIFDSWAPIPADDEFWNLAIGDPGPDHLFDFQVYVRGAMTLHALRLEVGDADFFRILRLWTTRNAGDNVTTADFIRLAERTSGEGLDALFATWLGSGYPLPVIATARAGSGSWSLEGAPAASQSLAKRLHDRTGRPAALGGTSTR